MTDAAAALSKNKKTFVSALADRRLVIEVAAGWEALGEVVIGTDKPGDGRLELQPLALHVEKLDKSLHVVDSGAGLTKAGPFLAAVKGDLPGLFVDAVVRHAEASADTSGVLKHLAKLPGRILRAGGWAQLAADVAILLAGKLSPDPVPNSHPVVTVDGDVKAHIANQKLSHIANDFYDTHGYAGGAAERDHRGPRARTAARRG